MGFRVWPIPLVLFVYISENLKVPLLSWRCCEWVIPFLSRSCLIWGLVMLGFTWLLSFAVCTVWILHGWKYKSLWIHLSLVSDMPSDGAWRLAERRVQPSMAAIKVAHLWAEQKAPCPRVYCWRRTSWFRILHSYLSGLG